jgi:hypothetical protein
MRVLYRDNLPRVYHRVFEAFGACEAENARW